MSRVCGAALRRKHISLKCEQRDIGMHAVDGVAGGHRHDDIRHAARHLLDRQACAPDVVAADTERLCDPCDVFDSLSELGQLLRHPCKVQPIAVPFKTDRGRADVQSKDPLGCFTRDTARSREGERAANHRMPRHRHFGARRKYPHPYM